METIEVFDMRVLFVSVIVAVLSAAYPAHSQEAGTIGYMRDACKALTNSNNDDYFFAGFCAGFILGTSSSRNLDCQLINAGSQLDIYSSTTARNLAGHSLPALTQAFINWADDHPELWRKPIVFAVSDPNLWSEFPCETDN